MRQIPLALLLLPLSAVVAHLAAQDAPARGDREVSYDIPLQSLSAALNAFAATSGMQVLYETSLAEGRTSAPINGIFVPESALRVILAGTGLAGRRTDVDAITIVPDVRDQRRGTSMVMPDAQFLGALQAGIVNALCARKETRPGDYRLAFQIWTTPTGTIRRASLLNTTGMALRDAALAEVLHGASAGAIPPPGMSQPITMIIMPRETLQRSECSPQ